MGLIPCAKSGSHKMATFGHGSKKNIQQVPKKLFGRASQTEDANLDQPRDGPWVGIIGTAPASR
jgi:hypothetical protein